MDILVTIPSLISDGASPHHDTEVQETSSELSQSASQSSQDVLNKW